MSTVQGLASIGIDVKVNSVAMNFVKDIGSLGGKPSELDSTCMKDTMKKSVPGVQEGGNFEVTYLFDNADSTSDYRVLKTLQAAGNAVAVVVEFPCGTKFTSSGYVSTWVEGVGVDALIQAKLSVALQSDWTVTNPSGGGGA